MRDRERENGCSPKALIYFIAAMILLALVLLVIALIRGEGLAMFLQGGGL